MTSTDPHRLQNLNVRANNVKFDSTALAHTAIVSYDQEPSPMLPSLPIPESEDHVALHIFHEHPDDVQILHEVQAAAIANDLTRLQNLMRKVHLCSLKLSICVGFGQGDTSQRAMYTNLIHTEKQKDIELYQRLSGIYQRLLSL